MNQARLEWKVGLFVCAGLVLLAVLLLQFSKGMTFFRPTYDLQLHAENVGGLKTRAAVLMAGVQVGTVTDIRLAADSRSVIITLRIFSQYAIHKDARFVIEQSGFLGDQYVAILPTENTAPLFADGGEAFAEAPFNMQEVARAAGGFLQRIEQTAKVLNESIADLRGTLLNPQTLTNVAVAATNLRLLSERTLGLADNVAAWVATNGPALAQSSSNLAVFSGRMEHFADALNGVVSTNRVLVEDAVKNIESSTVLLKNLLEQVQAGKGFVGNLLTNDQLAASMSQIANNLSITSSNLNRLGLWSILWRHKPPRTNAPPAAPLTAPKNPYE